MDLREINWLSIALRVLMAAAIGGVLGLGRERKNRAAGFRTYMLVSVGAAMVMMTNQYVFQQFGVSDLVRMGAQVVSGIGFLGAGTIIITGKNKIRGITTAAGLWTAACCGLAVGIGFYEGALIGGLAVFLIISVMKRLDSRIRRHAKSVDVYIEFDTPNPFRSFVDYTRSNALEIDDMHIQRSGAEGEQVTSIVATVESKNERCQTEMIELLSLAPNVRYIEEVQ
jgi:putative Mg2+ transporter-C (MgtC) family protein